MEQNINHEELERAKEALGHVEDVFDQDESLSNEFDAAANERGIPQGTVERLRFLFESTGYPADYADIIYANKPNDFTRIEVDNNAANPDDNWRTRNS